MDTAYDHLQESVIEAGEEGQEKGKEGEKQDTLNAEFAEAYKAFSNSPWGARFGAFVGTVRKQGESYLETTKKEYSHVSQQFSSVATTVVNRTRGLSLTGRPQGESSTAHKDDDGNQSDASSSKDTIRPSEGFMSRIKAGLTELEKVEARADEYILQFGTNIGNFLKEAVTIAPPEGETFHEEGAEGAQKDVVFEAKEDGSKRKIYTTRLDAQLHLLHTNVELFKNVPTGPEYTEFAKNFSADAKTEQIAKDLEAYPELRTVMESLVPDSVQYPEFWKHYYFLRAQLDSEEQKRKEILKGALQEEEVAWDDDEEEEEEEDDDEEESDEEDDDEDEGDSEEDDKPNAMKSSTGTLQAPPKPKVSTDRTSQADSDTSYDIVSGAPSNAASQAGGSPPKPKNIDNDSDDEDWE